MHICVCAHMHTHVHIYAYMHTYAYAYTYTQCMSTHTRAPVHTHARMHTCIHIYTHTLVHTRAHTCAHAHIRAYTRSFPAQFPYFGLWHLTLFETTLDIPGLARSLARCLPHEGRPPHSPRFPSPWGANRHTVNAPQLLMKMKSTVKGASERRWERAGPRGKV